MNVLIQFFHFVLLSNGSVEVVEEEGSRNSLRINVLVHILLNLGAKSFSHSFAAIAKFHATFKSLADAEDGERVLSGVQWFNEACERRAEHWDYAGWDYAGWLNGVWSLLNILNIYNGVWSLLNILNIC